MPTIPPRPQPEQNDPVDESSRESFPASDPPAWTPDRPGAPDRKKADLPDETAREQPRR